MRAIFHPTHILQPKWRSTIRKASQLVIAIKSFYVHTHTRQPCSWIETTDCH